MIRNSLIFMQNSIEKCNKIDMRDLISYFEN